MKEPLQSPDVCSPEDQERMQRVNEWLEKVTLLASTLGLAQQMPRIGKKQPSVTDRLDEIDFGHQVSELNIFTPEGIMVHYSGPGYTWTLDEAGKPITVYKDSSNPVKGIGEIRGVKIMDEFEVEYDCVHCLGLQHSFTRDDDGEIVIDDSMETNECIEPEENDQIFLEVEHRVFESDTDDIEVGGSCVRSNYVSFSSLLVASSVTIELITPSSEHAEVCEQDEMQSTMTNYARQVNKLVRDTGFRRESAVNQRKQLEELLQTANSYLAVDRFGAHAYIDTFYECSLEDGVWDVFRATNSHKGKGGVYACVLEPVRIDSLEMHRLNRSEAIRHNNDLIDTDTSLYLVAEIEPELQDTLETKSSVVWIPIPVPRNRKQKKRGNSPPDPLLDIVFIEQGLDEPTLH